MTDTLANRERSLYWFIKKERLCLQDFPVGTQTKKLDNNWHWIALPTRMDWGAVTRRAATMEIEKATDHAPPTEEDKRNMRQHTWYGEICELINKTQQGIYLKKPKIRRKLMDGIKQEIELYYAEFPDMIKHNFFWMDFPNALCGVQFSAEQRRNKSEPIELFKKYREQEADRNVSAADTVFSVGAGTSQITLTPA